MPRCLYQTVNLGSDNPWPHAKVYSKNMNGEHRVCLYALAKHQLVPKAVSTYFTNDLDDAIGTANSLVEHERSYLYQRYQQSIGKEIVGFRK